MSPSHAADHVSTEALFRQHADFVTRFLARLGVPPDHLEDALQEVFLVVHRHGGYRPGIAKPTSYLANIAIRAAAQHRRKQAVARTRSSQAPLEHIASDAKDPAHTLEAQRDLERLQLALERLPEELRTVLLLVEVEGDSCISVAAGLGCPVGTVYWRLHQARKKLQTNLALLETPRRERRDPQAQLTPAPIPKRAVHLGSLTMFASLFDFQNSEAARLLRRAREQPQLPIEPQLARHQALLRAGAELPAWAGNYAPHAASWSSVLGLGPITVGVTALGALSAVLFLSQSTAPAPKSNVEVQQVRAPIPAPVSAEAAEAAPAAAPGRDPVIERSSAAAATRRPAGSERAPINKERALPSSRSAAATAAAARGRGVATAQGAQAAGQAPAPSPEPQETAEEAQPAAVEQPQPQPPQPAAQPAYDPTAAEMREVAQAERLLASDPEEALALSRRVRARFEAGFFAEERSYVEVMALYKLGRNAELRASGDAFLRAYPDGPYSARVRKALATVPAEN